MTTFRTLFVLAIAFTLPHQAFSWGNIGHETVAEIAERYYAPETKTFLQSILGPEPLSVASTWPDQVRSDSRFKGFSPFHFIEILNGTKYVPDVKQNGHTIIQKVPGLLRSDLSRERKMILLRYLVHVVGDVHQPLHVGNGQDMGANLCNVYWVRPAHYGRKNPDKEFLNLHTVWDENLIEAMKEEFQRKNSDPKSKENPQKRWFGYYELADWILEEGIGSKHPKSAATKPGLHSSEVIKAWADAAPLDWYAESRALHHRVYPETPFETEPSKRKYCKWKNPKTGKVENGGFDPKFKAPTLDEAYTKARTPLVRELILKGGLRLARLLDRIAQGHGIEVEKDIAILESLMLVNEE